MEDLPEEEQVVSLVRFHDSLLCFTNVIGSCYYFSSLNLINGLWLSYGIWFLHAVPFWTHYIICFCLLIFHHIFFMLSLHFLHVKQYLVDLFPFFILFLSFTETFCFIILVGISVGSNNELFSSGYVVVNNSKNYLIVLMPLSISIFIFRSTYL